MANPLPPETAAHLEFQLSLLRLCAVPHLRESVKPEVATAHEAVEEFAEIPATAALQRLKRDLR